MRRAPLLIGGFGPSQEDGIIAAFHRRRFPLRPTHFLFPILVAGLLFAVLPARLVLAEDPGWGGRAAQMLPARTTVGEVQVLDAETGEPVAGAVVQAAGEVRFADGDGRSAWPAAGPYVVRAVGYEPIRLWTARPVVRLHAVAHSGRVVGRDGEPIMGAIVAHDGVWAETDAAGRFVFRGDLMQGGEVIVKRPGYRPFEGAWDGKSALVLEPIDLRALYVSFPRLSPNYVPDLFERMAERGYNGVVVDAKSDRGLLGWDSQVPLASELPEVNSQAWMPITDVLKLARQYNFYTIARIVTFKDHPLATTFPERAVRRADGSVWIDAEELGWSDPFQRENWEYNIELGKELAAMGFDEINYDYIRLPTDGAIGEIDWPEEHSYEIRTGAIAGFLNEVRLALRPTRALFSGDVFGLVPTVRKGNDMGIGQTVETMAPYMDIFCPMVYPSTFIPGNLGLDDPHREPYEVIYRSVVAAGKRSSTPVRPWLQGYSLGVQYGPAEWSAQVQATLDSTDMGFIFWIASGRYDGLLSADLPARAEPSSP